MALCSLGDAMSREHAMKRGLVVVAMIVGLGLVAAPGIFQMFTRAPGGGHMINGFRTYMAYPKITQFQGYMTEIGNAQDESDNTVPALLGTQTKTSPAQFAAQYTYVAEFNQQWPSIYADFDHSPGLNMLSKMQRMVPNYKAVAALPPFWMFPWFFVIPGLIVAVLAVLALRADRRRGAGSHLVALATVGVMIILAPAIFQMFTRAPLGATMIDTFKPIMSTSQLATVQNDFVVIAAAEGQLRTDVEPALAAGGMTSAQIATQLPALTTFHRDWPTISANMAPMIGVMADNLANFNGIAALPPFWLFPWFFVIPGTLIAGLAFAARYRRNNDSAQPHSEQTSVGAPTS